MKGSNFHHHNSVGLALAPQSIATADAAVAGSTISEPWRTGRQITFIVLLGAIDANGSLTLKVQGLQRSDGTTWVQLKETDGTTGLAFTATLMDDGQDNSVFIGTLPLEDIDASTYSAIRLIADEDGSSSTVIVGAAYVISDLREIPSGMTDDLFSKVHPYQQS